MTSQCYCNTSMTEIVTSTNFPHQSLSNYSPAAPRLSSKAFNLKLNSETFRSFYFKLEGPLRMGGGVKFSLLNDDGDK